MGHFGDWDKVGLQIQIDVIDWHFFEFFDYQLVLVNTNCFAMSLMMFSDEENLYTIIASISNGYCGTKRPRPLCLTCVVDFGCSIVPEIPKRNKNRNHLSNR